MKKLSSILLIATLAIVLIAPQSYAQRKLAQTGFQFLSVGIDARATALGEAFTTVGGTSVAMFYNPAGIASLSSFIDLSFMVDSKVEICV